jgi:hypothetical protein
MRASLPHKNNLFSGIGWVQLRKARGVLTLANELAFGSYMALAGR